MDVCMSGAFNTSCNTLTTRLLERLHKVVNHLRLQRLLAE